LFEKGRPAHRGDASAMSHGVTLRPWQRLHQALMPDYNRKATIYWWSMVLLGGIALALAAWEVQQLPAGVVMQIVVGTAFAAAAGFFPVRIPGSKNSFVAGEVFIFLLLLMHGPAAATVAAAGEGFVGAYRSSKRWTSRIASLTFAALAMGIAGHVMEFGITWSEGRSTMAPALVLLIACVVAMGYFALNTYFVSMIITLKRGERFNLNDHVSNFGTVGIAFGGSALIAALLHLTVRQSGMSVLFGALPVVAMLLTTVHYFMRQQEAHEAMRRSRIEAAEREAQQAARHVAALSESERRFHSAFTHASIGMALVSVDGRILQANTALAGILGHDKGQALIDRPFSTLVSAGDRAAVERDFARIGARQLETFNAEVRCLHSSGTDLWTALHCAFFTESDSEAPCLILQLQDISARRHAEAQLNHIAFHDSLTGLPNRSRFLTLLAQALNAARQEPQRHFAVMFLDFDRFKLINDSMGHSAGDAFLIQVSRRIQDHVRPGDVVARLGGDEFAVLLHQVAEAGAATAMAERLQQVLKQPLQVGGVNVSTSASIGITFSKLGYTTPEDVVRDADIAMYRAKAAGKARYAVFDAQLHSEVAQRMLIESDLRQALAQGELHVAYQPLFDIGNGRLRGFEALARWTHPQRGEIGPSTFIQIAEDSGLIVELTDFMLHQACRQMAQWHALDPRLAELKLQVNLSGSDLAHSALFERVQHALASCHFDPRQLTLELTENILMQRIDSAMLTLDALRKLGVSLAIDDFGTGYSSLAYLSSLPIDSLKIDRSFVHGMRREGSKDAEIVRAIVSLGATLGKSVVAEGIESVSQLAQLRELGCEHGQGFHLSRPLSPEQAGALLGCLLAETGEAAATAAPYDTGLMPLVRH
jgi:diguanylate cyclase (GGDEF)-like protein/PAS domain S-box-containing protein